jgi:coenzyme F420 hydrogenase subunit beta
MNLTKKGVYAPSVQSSRCTHCEKCIQACPGIGINVHKISSTLFQAPLIKYRPDIGHYTGCYVGHATDPRVRQHSTSGGAITALLSYLLENQLIQGALVTKAHSTNPLETESFIARSVDDLELAATSRYCPTSPNTVLAEVLRENGVFAVVGLPCHIHGIRKAEQIYPILKSKILLHVGLFCSGVPTFIGTYELLHQLDLEKSAIKQFKYRVGWPSTSVITLKNGRTYHHQFQKTLLSQTWGLRFFLSPRCTLCFDTFNELADIAFGDAHLPRTDNSSLFRSLMITRSPHADQILKRAVTHIHSEPVAPTIAARTQHGALQFKGKVKTRINMRQFLNKAVPQYDIKYPSPTPIDYGKSLFYYLNMACGSREALNRYIPYLAKIEHRVMPAQ